MKRFNLLVALLLVVPAVAQAQYQVYVGYADNLRPSPFFPTPWCGAVNTVFRTHCGGGGYDDGAFLIVNTSGGAINVAVTAHGFGNGFAKTWAPVVNLAAGWNAIFSAENPFDFDTSDDCGGTCGNFLAPLVNVNGVDYADTGMVLNTSNCDCLAQNGLNESHQWRLIGTVGGQVGTGIAPEPATNVMLGTGLIGLLGIASRRRK